LGKGLVLMLGLRIRVRGRRSARLDALRDHVARAWSGFGFGFGFGFRFGFGFGFGFG